MSEPQAEAAAIVVIPIIIIVGGFLFIAMPSYFYYLIIPKLWMAGLKDGWSGAVAVISFWCILVLCIKLIHKRGGTS